MKLIMFIDSRPLTTPAARAVVVVHDVHLVFVVGGGGVWETGIPTPKMRDFPTLLPTNAQNTL